MHTQPTSRDPDIDLKIDLETDPNTESTLSLPSRLAVIGTGMLKNNALLPEVLEAKVVRWYPWSSVTHTSNNLPEAFIGWGRKKSHRRASKAGKRLNKPVYSIEDGFLRSIDAGIHSRHGLSVVMDDIGIYFDSNRSSRLEHLIVHRLSDCDAWHDQHQHRSSRLLTRIIDQQLSKYNATIDCPNLSKLTPAHQHVLLIDQVAGDASIAGAGANKRSFAQMLKMARRQYPQAQIWVKTHPAGNSGYLINLSLPKDVQVIDTKVNSIALLQQVDAVYTVSSHMGFEALMLGKCVHCFGVSWYAGWGLTDDRHAPKKLLQRVHERRSRLISKPSTDTTDTLTLNQLFYAAYIDYSRYVDPASRQPCSIETAIDWLVTNRNWQHKLQGKLTVYEFSRWKLPFVRAFVGFPDTKLFIKPKPRLKNLLHPDHFWVDYNQPMLVWGLAKRQQLQQRLQARRVKIIPHIWCMEDGFIRSNGLGATLLAPLSVVLDRSGIYYDATHPSDLEQLILHCPPLTDQQNQRVQQLIQRLLTQRVSKYNVGKQVNIVNASVLNHDTANSSQPKILIIGQVEDDLSVQYCGSAIVSNTELIEHVRSQYPKAYLIYKPHPDVEAGLRSGKVDKPVLRLVDAIARDMPIADCLDRADAVHTISSQAGFEALLRGIPVHCYGVPFYAGWGLTIDEQADDQPKARYLKRRQRLSQLTLEQLVYCALITYPIYRLPSGHGLAQVEQIVDHLYPSSIEHSHQQANGEDSPKTSITVVKQQLLTPSKTKIMQLRHRVLQLRRGLKQWWS